MTAWAQEDGEERTAAARALFERGMEFVDGGDFEQAADRFERSLDLRFSPVVAYNLSIALAEVGRYVEASERLREVIRSQESEPRLVEAAQAKLDQVLSHVGRLTVVVTGASETVDVHRNGERLDEALVGVAQPVDPGEHRVSLHRGGEELAARAVTVSPGGRETVELEAPPPPVPTPAETASSQPSSGTGAAAAPSVGTGTPGGTREQEGSSVFSSPWLWTGVAVVIAGGIVAAILMSRGAPEPVHGDFEPAIVEFDQ